MTQKADKEDQKEAIWLYVYRTLKPNIGDSLGESQECRIPGDYVVQWMTNPYRRWFMQVLFSPIYVVCWVSLFIYVIVMLSMADWG